ncbi:MAG: hypothetical protein PVI57_02510 [Gemmatimonadota bacterium]|jgi:hypothetical protein
MPSDTAVSDPVVEALAGPRDEFRSAVVSSAEELRGMLSDAGSSDDERADFLAAELGPFAAGRIDAGRLATLLSEKETLPPHALDTVRRAVETLEEIVEGDGIAPVLVEVPPDGDLRDAVRDALTRAGRVFGVARAADLARTGSYRADDHAGLFEGLPFRSWTTGERGLAPPVIVRVRGEDLRPAGLADFLDGGLKIVLRVQGDAPPASLARLVTPAVMVVQATAAEELSPLAGFPGPAVAALFEGAPGSDGGADGVVRYTHDPRRGVFPWKRIELKEELETLRKILEERRWKRRSWKEDLEHLIMLATPPQGSGETAGVSASEETPEPVTGADRLAAWLLARTDLDED